MNSIITPATITFGSVSAGNGKRVLSYFKKRRIIEKLKISPEPWALPHLQPALEGNEDSALRLIAADGNDKRGLLAVAFWDLKVARPAYRTLLSAAWGQDHREVIAAAKDRKTIQAMFLYAATPVPILGSVVRVWRGTTAQTIDQAAAGYSWTLDKDIACWFALRYSGPNSSALVVVAEVPKQEIIYFSDERDEKEVLLKSPPRATIDGSHAEWFNGYRRVNSKHQREHRTRLRLLNARKKGVAS